MELRECELGQLLINEQSPAQRVLLREKDGGRCLAMDIGMVEALAIKNGLQENGTPRPMTHDLLLAVMRSLGGRLERAVINDLATLALGGVTFLAVLEISTDDGRRQLIDCRPSDALALVVRTGRPLFVSEKVLSAAGTEETP